jgi:hypothetical protein
MVSSETRAYRETIIPDPYHKFTIFNFDGMTEDKSKKIVSTELAARAVKSILDYCWKGVTPDMLYTLSKEELDKRTTIQKSYELGRNVVIYGEQSESNFGGGRKSGKTFSAAIILRAAIESRTPGEPSYSQNYDWVEYTTLRDIIYGTFRDKDVESMRLYNELKNINWLVIDNIPVLEKSAANVIDPFFIYRFENKLPTILVFRFDAEKITSEKMYGLGIYNILNYSHTTFIKLS